MNDMHTPFAGGLTLDEINKIVNSGKTKNQYGPQLAIFLNDSDQAGINVRETWPDKYNEKDVTALYQGFVNASKKANVEDLVRVIRRDEDVFLIHKQRAALLQATITTQNGNSTDDNDD